MDSRGGVIGSALVDKIGGQGPLPDMAPGACTIKLLLKVINNNALFHYKCNLISLVTNVRLG